MKLGPRATCRITAVCGTMTLVALLAVATSTESQLNVLDLAQTWSFSSPKRTLDYAKAQYGAEVVASASRGLVVAPVLGAVNIAGGLPRRGVVVGFLFTSGPYASTSRYRLPGGTYAVVLRLGASGLFVEFRNPERVVIDPAPVVEELSTPVKAPVASLQSGRPCYTVDSRRICP